MTLASRADGTRTWIVRVGDDVRVFGRPRDEGIISDYTKKLPEVIEAARTLPSHDFIIDGEAVVYDEKGRTWFEGSQRRCGVEDPNKIREYRKLYPIVQLSFDLIRLDGKELHDFDYEARKSLLRELLHLQPIGGSLQYLKHVIEGKRRFYQHAVDFGEEGLVLKLLGSRYEEGRRSPSWLKVKKWYSES